MSAPAPTAYQREAVANALDIFRYAESQWRQADDDAGRAAATAFNGCLLPEFVELPVGARKSCLNAYGVMPPDLNGPELAFAELLDADLSGTVDYWWRNEPRKPWSIALVMPGGERYFPNFTIRVAGRRAGDGLLLMEIKGQHILNDTGTLDKVLAEHKTYGAPLMLAQDDGGRFMTVRYFPNTGRNAEDQIFRVQNLPGY